MIIVAGAVRARPGALAEVLRISLEHVHRSRLEPGCLLHSVHTDAEDPNRFVFIENWADRAPLDAHFGVRESRAFAKALNDLSSEPPTMEIYEAQPLAF